jgi:hypothetical protein
MKYYAILKNNVIVELVYSDSKPVSEYEVIQITEKTFNLLAYNG